MNYKKAFEMLVEVTKQRSYCNNCFAGNLDEDHPDWRCDDCHRKMMGWKLDPQIVENIKKECEVE